MNSETRAGCPAKKQDGTTRQTRTPGRRIHITGAPRSGTTLLHVLFLTCFEIDGRVEEERRLRRPAPKGRSIVCTKCPDETCFTAGVLSVDAKLFAVYIERDPRDVIASEHGRWPGRYFTNLRVWRRNARAARKAGGHERFIVVDYARLVREPDKVQAELMTAMPFLRPTLNFSRFHQAVHRPIAEWGPAMHAIRPITEAGLDGWRRHLPRVKGQIQRHGDLTPDLIAGGYETDASWAEVLADVPPDLTPSLHRETLSPRKRVTDRLICLRDAASYLIRNVGPVGIGPIRL